MARFSHPRLLPYALLVALAGLPRPPPAWAVPSGGATARGAGVGSALLVHPDVGVPAMARGIVPVSWREFGKQLARRLQWDVNQTRDAISMHVMALSQFCTQLGRGLNASLVLGIDWPKDLPWRCADLQRPLEKIPTRLFYNSSSLALAEFPSSHLATQRKARKVQKRVLRLLGRKTEEELIWAFLLLTDKHLAKVQAVQEQLPHPHPGSLARAAALCGPQFLACGVSPSCMKGLFCIALCHLDDQTCAYKCLLKYESWLISKFSACAFEKQLLALVNVMNFHTLRPRLPAITPLEGFDNTQLNIYSATRILIGHAHEQKFSWLVAAASSEAYAQFKLQYQIWYYRRSQRRLYYKAVFLSEGRDGHLAWRSRSYVTLPLRTPGAWLFAAADGGVQLREHWYLLGADAQLRWMLIYFKGAARKAGMAYRGCMLLTPDGKVPGRSAMPMISEALAKAEMQP
ncbi:unnamed protein product [Durusdinium trenchii]|uniref:VDE lipocalin domain-containing protein n=1 Tax=Durusdinium trenchii TaxID=1381693 RepID=A0ABP0JIM9_9DINO